MPLALAGLVAYTRIESPAPTVIAMVAFIGLQLVGWSIGG